MNVLNPFNIVSSVRQEGSLGNFEKRTFHLMLDAFSAADKQQKEAIRIIRQLGFETQSLQIVYPMDEEPEA